MSFFFHLWQLWVPLENEMIDLKGFILGVIHFSNITGAFVPLAILWSDITAPQMLYVVKVGIKWDTFAPWFKERATKDQDLLLWVTMQRTY